jgi:anti-sigma factor RsiW
MNCAETNLQLHAYVDGELDVIRSLEVEKHARDCKGCAAKLASLKSLHAALAESELAYHAPASLRHRVQQMAPASNHQAVARPADWQWLWKLFAVGATTVAVLLLLLRPAGILQNGTNDELVSEAVSSHVRSLMPGHLTDVVSSDQHTVKPWFDGKLNFAPPVKDFTQQEYPLVGGRLDYLDGRTVAALVYRHNKHFINVFIWPAAGGNNSGEQITSENGYTVIRREVNGFHYYFVSDMDESGLDQLAGMVWDQKQGGM